MVCPVGLNAASACAAMRAGIAKFDELAYLDRCVDEPIIGSSVPTLDDGLRRSERLLEMAAGALIECTQNVEQSILARIPLLIALPEPGRPGCSEDLSNIFIPLLEERLNLRFHPRLSQVVTKGHAGAGHAIRIMLNLFRDNRLPACLICGVDSFINSVSIRWLEETDRLKTEANSDGVIPGEAAAAVLFEFQTSSPQPSMTQLIGLGLGDEKATVLSDLPLLGLGLAEAVRSALLDSQLTLYEIDWQLSDVTGERYGFKENALMVSRVLRKKKETFPLWHVGDSIGDIGAASGVCQMVVADHACLHGYAPGPRVLCSMSSLLGERAAIVLHHHPASDGGSS